MTIAVKTFIRREVIEPFVYIGGIDDQRCLNFH